MKKQLLLVAVFFLVSYTAFCQIISFDDQGYASEQSLGNPFLIVNAGETFRFSTDGPSSQLYRNTDPLGCNNTGHSHLGATSGISSASIWTIETVSGNEINLGNVRFDNLFLCYSFVYNLSIQAYKNNIAVGVPQILNVNGMNTVWTPNTDFDDIDKIVISCADLANLGIDDINWTLSSLSSEDFVSSNTFKIFPNPSSQFVKVSGLSEATDYMIYDVIGNEIKKGNISNLGNIFIQDFESGVYILKIGTGDYVKFIKK